MDFGTKMFASQIKFTFKIEKINREKIPKIKSNLQLNSCLFVKIDR